jgi:ferredoxin/flavodoxin---NADP+ reductase
VTHVIRSHCFADTRCVAACPVDSIHPAPGEPGFGQTGMLYIDPSTCIDCGACADVCPVDAISADHDLPVAELPFLDLGREFAARQPQLVGPPKRRTQIEVPVVTTSFLTRSHVRIAVVGSGASGLYTAEYLLADKRANVELHLIERLDRIGGLARYGVAPDHGATRGVVRHFESILKDPRIVLRLGTEVGQNGVRHEELCREYDAVVYAVGASQDRELTIPGSGLPGLWGAAHVARWYNGHPSTATESVELCDAHAVVIGNGNVGLDVARMLLSSPETVSSLEVPPEVGTSLSKSKIRHVTVVGRSGPERASFSYKELLGLTSHGDFSVQVDQNELPQEESGKKYDFEVQKKLNLLRRHSLVADDPGRARRLELRFGWSPRRLVGATRVEGIFFERTSNDHAPRTLELGASLVVSAIGMTGTMLEGVPFDRKTGRLPVRKGRVIDPESATPVPKTYATGWIASGASGTIGRNRKGAYEVAESLIEDIAAGVYR